MFSITFLGQLNKPRSPEHTIQRHILYLFTCILFHFQTATFPKVSHETFCMFVSQPDPRQEMFTFCPVLSQVETYSKKHYQEFT
jgi:hypothetical protein